MVSTKQLTNILRTAQNAMERKVVNIRLQNKVSCSKVRPRMKIIDIE